MSALTHNLAEAAAAMGCTERWLADQLRANRFPARKLNGRWRMTDADIEQALEICRRPAKSEISVGGMTATTRRRVAS